MRSSPVGVGIGLAGFHPRPGGHPDLMAPFTANHTKESVDTEQLLSMLFLFAGPVIAFVAAVVIGW